MRRSKIQKLCGLHIWKRMWQSQNKVENDHISGPAHHIHCGRDLHAHCLSLSELILWREPSSDDRLQPFKVIGVIWIRIASPAPSVLANRPNCVDSNSWQSRTYSFGRARWKISQFFSTINQFWIDSKSPDFWVRPRGTQPRPKKLSECFPQASS